MSQPTDHQTDYGMTVQLTLPYQAAVERTRAELSKEGFGVLTEIDVRETLKKKLDVEFRPYIILGACNPTLAHRALSEDPDIGLLLPCNVVVYAGDDPDHSTVVAIDPVVQLGVAGNEALQPIASEVRTRLARVLNGLTRDS
jgi:uncharacterized protein (DUF302 family)